MTGFRQTWFLLLIAAMFAIGHGHQVFGRFVAHHHGIEYHELDAKHHDADHDHDMPGPEHDDHGTPAGSDHDAWHHAIAAVAAVPAFSLVSVSFEAAIVTEAAQPAPDAPVFGIEHPPQLARA